MRSFPILLCGLLAALLLSACGQQPAEISAEPEIAEPVEAPEEPAVKTEFTREELLADYGQLWEILEENYPFLPVLEEHCIDWEQLRADYREKLRTQEPDVADFAALIRKMFSQMENFAHLDLAGEDELRLYLDDPPERSPSLTPWYEAVTAPQTRAVYALLSSGTEYAPETEYPEVETGYYPDCKAAYFHFRSFNYSLKERDSTVIADYLATLDEVEHVIIDITGNSGGDFYSVIQNVIEPLGGEVAWTNYTFLAKSPANAHFFLETGALEAQPLSELPENTVYPEFAEELGMNHYISTQVTCQTGEDNGPAAGAKRWVLIDGAVFSTSETFARFCKDTGWATLVGTRTLGDGDGLAPVLVPLDHTGLLLKFSTTSCANADGSLNAEAGAAPDYPCKPGELPLRKCLELIRNG